MGDRILLKPHEWGILAGKSILISAKVQQIKPLQDWLVSNQGMHFPIDIPENFKEDFEILQKKTVEASREALIEKYC